MLNKSVIISFNHSQLQIVRSLNKTILITYLMSEAPTIDKWKEIYNTGLNLKYSIKNQEIIDIARSGNISIGTWYHLDNLYPNDIELKNSQFITSNYPIK